MRCTVTFHGPFRVATGLARDGYDTVPDLLDPVPATSLKGLTRASAATLLGADRHPLVAEVFGARGQPSPWSWTGVTFADGAPTSRAQAQVSIDPTTGTADERALLLAEELWAPGPGTFDIDLMTPLDPAVRRQHEDLLAASVSAIVSLGGQRRRGLGWVSISVLPAPDVVALVDRVLALRGAP